MIGSEMVKIKLEEKIEVLRNALHKVNVRLGDEEVTDSDDDDGSILSDENDDEQNPVINTRHFERDHLFAEKYYFKTNVCFSLEFNLFVKYMLQIYLYLSSERVIGTTWTISSS